MQSSSNNNNNDGYYYPNRHAANNNNGDAAEWGAAVLRSSVRRSPQRRGSGSLRQQHHQRHHHDVTQDKRPPFLSEGAVQRSVRTFEDGAWMRDQAVRSYAQFHNSMETLHTAMKGQLRALWRTAMQLRPRILRVARQQAKADITDDIPEGIAISSEEVQRIIHQEMILEELVADLQVARDSSIRFAAHWLTDEEKASMGADPAYLRPEDIDRDLSLQREGMSTRTSVACSHHNTPSRRRTAAGGGSNSNYNRRNSGGGGGGGCPPRDDPQLTKLRKLYMLRMAELSGEMENEQHQQQQQRRGRRRSHRSGHEEARSLSADDSYSSSYDSN